MDRDVNRLTSADYSAVEQATVNRLADGSNPSRGAKPVPKGQAKCTHDITLPLHSIKSSNRLQPLKRCKLLDSRIESDRSVLSDQSGDEHSLAADPSKRFEISPSYGRRITTFLIRSLENYLNGYQGR